MSLNIKLLWHKIKPKCIPDAISMVYAQVLIHSVCVYGAFCVLPWMKETHGVSAAKEIFYYIFGAFLYLSVEGRIWKIIDTNTATVGKILPTLLRPGWNYCAACEANSPPRAFHCHICNKCILKRDHHCLFTGKCIGHFNYAFYLMLVFYVWLGTLFALIVSYDFLMNNLGDDTITATVYFVFPIFCYLFGYLNFYVAITTFIYLLCFLFFVAFSGLLVVHSRNVYHGIVSFERKMDIYTYDLGYQENFRNVFGTNWYFVTLCFFVDPHLHGDGMNFVTKESYEPPKKI